MNTSDSTEKTPSGPRTAKITTTARPSKSAASKRQPASSDAVRVRRYEAFFAAFPQGLVIVDGTGRIQEANRAALDALATLANTQKDEAKGQRLVDLIPELAVDLSMKQQLRVARSDEIYDISVLPVPANGDGPLTLVSFDVITDEYIEQENRRADMAASSVVTSKVTTATSIEEAVRIALDAVRAEFNWVYGSFWQIDEATQELRFVMESGDAGPEFRAVTLSASFPYGVGLSGRTWASGDLYFTSDLGEMTDCSRAPVAQKVGVKTGVCFPITLDGKIIGTMDFFAKQSFVPSPERLEVLRNVGRLVSAALGRLDAKERARKVDQILEVVNLAASGDLRRDITVTGRDSVGQLAQGLGTLLHNLRSSMANMRETADNVASQAEGLAAVAHQLDSGANITTERAESSTDSSAEVVKSVQSVASAAEEMSASISEIARSATGAAAVAANAVNVVGEARQTVSSLGESSAQIGQVSRTITSIAQQTKLLALNATIEAARAGEAGKGFAVVANEVKELAKETARATEDIGQRIDSIQSSTQSAVTAIGEITSVIDQISDLQASIAIAVDQQRASIHSIAQNAVAASGSAQQINRDVDQVNKAAHATQVGSQDTLRSATQMTEIATELKAMVSRFKL